MIGGLRIGRAFLGGVALAVVVVAGCAQLAGLGGPPGTTAPVDAAPEVAAPEADAGHRLVPPDATPVAAACETDLDAGSAECQACISQQCCDLATACMAEPACAQYEQCLVPCADYACRSQCYAASPRLSSVVAAQLDACLVANCAAACQVSCGTASYTPPEAGDACHQCIAEGACKTADACFTNVGCSEVSQCAATKATIDQKVACVEQSEAGAAALFADYLFAAESAGCAAPCAIGSYWACLAEPFYPPFASSNQTALTLIYSTVGSAKPVANATVRSCLPDLADDCSQTVASGTTDVTGRVTLDLPATGMPPGWVGFSGYIRMSAPGFVDSLQFLEFPLAVAQVGFTETVDTPATLANFYAHYPGLEMMPGRGTLFLTVTDCHWLPAPDMTIVVTGAGPDATIAYNTPSTSATDITGAAFVFNALPNVTITVDVLRADGTKVAHGLQLFAVPGGVSTLAVHPNPN